MDRARRHARWKALAPWERRLLLRVLLLLPAIGAALRLLGFNDTRAWLERASGHAPGQASAGGPTQRHDAAQRIARLVDIAARRGPYRATCLRQSLALWWLLRRRGIAAELRVGVRREADGLRAHAWVEHQGRPLGSGARDHSPFPALPSSTAP